MGMELNEAFLKSLFSVGYSFPKKSVLISSGPMKDKVHLLAGIRKLVENGYTVYATKGTAAFLKSYHVPSITVHWPSEKKEPNALSCLTKGKVDLVINIPKSMEEKELANDYIIRRKAVDFNIPLITNAQVARVFLDAISSMKKNDLEIKSMEEYA